MRLASRPPHAGKRAVVGLATIALISGFSAVSASTTAASASAAPRFVALADSVPATTDHRIGSYSSSHMSIEVSLAPSHPAALASDLRAAYTKGSRGYHQWLRRGQFDAAFALNAELAVHVVRVEIEIRFLNLEHTGNQFEF